MEKILIVIDMQNDFIDGALGSPAAQAIVPYVCEKIKNWDSKFILYTFDRHHPFSYVMSAEGKSVPAHCMLDTKGYMLNDDIAEAFVDYTTANIPHGVVCEIEKDTFGSLEELPRQIEALNLQNPFEIHICGLCTDICVISNALILRAAFPMANIIVDAAGCAGTSKENHQAALQVMKANCITVINEGE